MLHLLEVRKDAEIISLPLLALAAACMRTKYDEESEARDDGLYIFTAIHPAHLAQYT